MILTAQEIKELATLAGFTISADPNALDTEYAIDAYPDTKVTEDGSVEYYDHIAYLLDYPEEGVFPMGNKAPEPKGA